MQGGPFLTLFSGPFYTRIDKLSATNTRGVWALKVKFALLGMSGAAVHKNKYSQSHRLANSNAGWNHKKPLRIGSARGSGIA